jgi:hypothetical protein
LELGIVARGGDVCRMAGGKHHVAKLQVVEVENSFQVREEYKSKLY